jgi:hypothetical protein
VKIRRQRQLPRRKQVTELQKAPEDADDEAADLREVVAAAETEAAAFRLALAAVNTETAEMWQTVQSAADQLEGERSLFGENTVWEVLKTEQEGRRRERGEWAVKCTAMVMERAVMTEERAATAANRAGERAAMAEERKVMTDRKSRLEEVVHGLTVFAQKLSGTLGAVIESSCCKSFTKFAITMLLHLRSSMRQEQIEGFLKLHYKLYGHATIMIC